MSNNILLRVTEYFSSDVECLGLWKPENLADVYFPLTFDVGQPGKEATVCFHTLVATPEGLRAFHASIAGRFRTEPC